MEFIVGQKIIILNNEEAEAAVVRGDILTIVARYPGYTLPGWFTAECVKSGEKWEFEKDRRGIGFELLDTLPPALDSNYIATLELMLINIVKEQAVFSFENNVEIARQHMQKLGKI